MVQRSLFELPELVVTPCTGATGPRLWIRRLVLWPEPGASPIQDVTFGPGLNIIWSPDPADRLARDEHPVKAGPGHGAGKTLVCRLLRYCLGETHYAPDALRRKVSSTFKDGRVGIELVVDGEPWAVVRSIGLFGHDVVLKVDRVELAAAVGNEPTGMAPLLDLLIERFLTNEIANLAAESPERAWLLALAWLARDQECHFGKATEWRAASSKSGSPAHGLSSASATSAVRALLGALTPREHELEVEVDRLNEARTRLAHEATRRAWLIDERRQALFRDLKLDQATVPTDDLFVPFLRRAAGERLKPFSGGNSGAIALSEHLEQAYETAREEVERLAAQISRVELAKQAATSNAAMIIRETPGLIAAIDDAAVPTCPICEVPIDLALAKGCKLSHQDHDVAALRARRIANESSLRDQRALEASAAEDLGRLRGELGLATSRRNKAWKELRDEGRRRDRRKNDWYDAMRVADDVKQLEALLSAAAATNAEIERLDAMLLEARTSVGKERDQHAHVFAMLQAHFDPLVRQLLGRDPEARGRIQHDGNGLHLIADYGGERATPAIDLLKVLAFDLATMCRSIEGTTKLPALLIHDSPRTSDLGLSIYHELFHVVRSLEEISPVPLFQYIVTTTSRPPDDLAESEQVRLKLSGAPAEARLLGRDL